MQPYYEHGGITIYHGDCREVLPELGKFDLLMTDPPYGIGAATKAFQTDGVKQHKSGFAAGKHVPKTDHGHSDWDDEPAEIAVLTGAIVKCRNSIIWGGNYFHLGTARCYLVWDKLRGDTTYADAELAWTDLDRTVRVFRFRWNGFLQEIPEERWHPTQKPLAVIKWAIAQAPDDVRSVFDPYMGSGTTLRAAKDMGLTAVGIEREERYCEIAAKRLSQEVLELQERKTA